MNKELHLYEEVCHASWNVHDTIVPPVYFSCPFKDSVCIDLDVLISPRAKISSAVHGARVPQSCIHISLSVGTFGDRTFT